MNADIAAQKAFDRLAHASFEQLSATDKILAAIWSFDAGVSNNGFASYFSSAAADMAFYVPLALKTIGAAGMAEIAAKANDVFGVSGPPKVRKDRQAMVRAFDRGIKDRLTALESQFYESPDDVDELLESYINRKQP